MNSMCISLHHLWWQRGTVITLASIKQTSIWTQMIYINHTNGAYKMYTITASQVPIFVKTEKVVLERNFDILFEAKKYEYSVYLQMLFGSWSEKSNWHIQDNKTLDFDPWHPRKEIRVSHNWIIRSSGISTSFQPSRWKKNSATSMGEKKNGCKWKLSILLSKVFGSMNCSNFFWLKLFQKIFRKERNTYRKKCDISWMKALISEIFNDIFKTLSLLFNLEIQRFLQR